MHAVVRRVHIQRLLLINAGSEETHFCNSTLPSQFSSVQRPDSRCMRVPPPPPLPGGQLGFRPEVRCTAATTVSSKTVNTTQTIAAGLWIPGAASFSDTYHMCLLLYVAKCRGFCAFISLILG